VRLFRETRLFGFRAIPMHSSLENCRELQGIIDIIFSIAVSDFVVIIEIINIIRISLVSVEIIDGHRSDPGFIAKRNRDSFF
jgi:hypothetical protein